MDEISLLKAILASATDYAIITLDDAGFVTSWNTGAERILGYKEQEIVGKDGAIIFTSGDRAQGEHIRELECASKTGRAADNRWHVRKDGSRFWGEGVVTPIRAPDGTRMGFLKIMHDNTDRKQVEDEMFHLANFDTLTGLANRSYFQTHLSEMLASTSRSNQLLILQLIDLDNFKQINDSLGHQAGDQLLQQAGARMRETIRDSDFIARLGGDEFVIIQPNARSPQAGGSLANKLLDVLSHPFELEGREVLTAASIGIALYPQDAQGPGELMKKADLALYRVKNDGRNGFSYFTQQMDHEAHQRGRNLRELRRAVEERDFWLEYQPEVDSESREIVSIEVLLRCGNPILSAYPIEEVVNLAEESGLMPEIGAWVITEACAQSEKWRNAGLSTPRISVNLCPRELMDPSIPNSINEILKQSGMPPHSLEIEITERQMFTTNGQGIKILERLRANGVTIALDDFGTGYSSLSYLRSLPVDRVKLAQSFLQEIPHDSQSCAIAKAVIAMAHTLNMEVVAEGVESVEQANFLQREHCDTLQGYLFSRPLRAEEMTRLLASRQPVPSQALNS